MPLLTCPDCGGKVSSTAPACPHCGYTDDSRPRSEPSSSQALCAIASFFVPGLGQLIQGRPVTAVVLFIACAFSWLVLMGWVFSFYAAWDASMYVPPGRRRRRKSVKPGKPDLEKIKASRHQPHPWDAEEEESLPPSARDIW